MIAETEQPTMEAAEFAITPRRVVFVRGRVEVVFPFGSLPGFPHVPDEATKALVEWLKARENVGAYFARRYRVWHFKPCVESLRKVVAWGKANGFTFGECVQAEARRLVAVSRENLHDSRAGEVSAMKGEVIELPAGLGGVPHPYQAAGIAFMARVGRGLNADEMGLGKTPQALVALGARGAWPAVIVCPGNVLFHWQREASRWLPGLANDVQVIETGKDTVLGKKLTIVTYDVLAGGVEKVASETDFTEGGDEPCALKTSHSSTAKLRSPGPLSPSELDNTPKPRSASKGAATSDPSARAETWRVVENSVLEALRLVRPAGVVIDEGHYAKNRKTKRYAALRELVHGVKTRFVLTGTPLENRPIELRPVLSLLGVLDQFGGWEAFAARYCAPKERKIRGGRKVWDLSGASNLGELRSKLRSFCMVRRLKRDVLPELPEKRRVVVPVALDPDSAREYRRAERDLVAWLCSRVTAAESGLTDAQLLRGAFERAKAAIEQNVENCEELVRMTALRQIAAKGKVAALKEWLECAIEGGVCPVVFGIHRAPVLEVAAAFGVKALTGSVAPRERQAMVDEFVKPESGNRKPDRVQPLFVAQLQAGGTGLNGLQAVSSDVVLLEQAWKPSVMEQAEDRLHRIGQRGSVTAWHFIARGTVDEWLLELNEGKRGIAAAGLDGRGG